MSVLTLTNEVIEALVCPPEKKHLEVFDEVLKGFYVDVLPSGRITYRIRYWQNSKKVFAKHRQCSNHASSRGKKFGNDGHAGNQGK